MNRYKCSKCGRFIKAKEIKATKEQIDKLDYPKEYVEFICAKCGKLNSWGVHISNLEKVGRNKK